MIREQIAVYGMHCAMCASKIEKKLNSFKNVSAHVALDSGKATIEYEETEYKLEFFKKEIKKLGYKVDNNNQTLNLIFLGFGALATIFFLIGELSVFNISVPSIFTNKYVSLSLASIVLFTLGLKFYKQAFFDIKNKSLGMDVLVVSGVSSAYLLSIYLIIKGESMLYFASVAMILTIVSIGKMIEEKVKHNTSYTVALLTSKIVHTATVIEEDDDDISYNVVSVNDINIGDKVLVKQGEVIPVDGVITKGVASVDEAIISGESKLVDKKIGSKVLASTILTEGTIEVRVTCKHNDTFISKIVEAVEDAANYKPPIQRLANKIASIFVPAVLLIGLVAFAGWLIYAKDFEKAIIVFASVELVSCPCALGLATPMAILVGSNRSAKYGILYKSGDFLEYARKLRSIYFDKTKTLTYGNMEVTSSTVTKEDAIYLVSLEKFSSHPIAKAILQYYPDVKASQVVGYENIIGMGIKGTIDGKSILVQRNDDSFDSTSVKLMIDGEAKGTITLADKIRDDSKEVVDKLKQMNIEVAMLTGDSESVAENVASSIGISNYHAKLNPIQKADIIKENPDSGFVGDGINDAVALRSANVGFAVSDGSDISVSASDVIFLKDDLSLVWKTIAISKITYRNIIVNLCFAFCYNVVAIPLACFGIMSPVISALMMAASHLLVVGNAIRIKYVKIK